MTRASDDNGHRPLPAGTGPKSVTDDNQLAALKTAYQDLFDQYEEAMARSNLLTVEAEVARMEFDQVFDAVGDALWVIDLQGKVLHINQAFLRLLGLESKSAAVGRKCHELLAANLCQKSSCPLKQIEKGASCVELDIDLGLCEEGRIPFWLTAKPLMGLTYETIGIVVQCKDIAERKNFENALQKANRELEKLAALDGLTQLANRRIFDETIGREWRRMRRDRKPLSAILCDIDFFKRYNDFYGHQKGDACLKSVAECMKGCLHRPSDLAARYGGEEFVILLPDTPSAGAVHVAEAIRTAIAAREMAHARSPVADRVTVSFGVATVVPPLDGGDAGDLVKAADEALYAAKNAGRDVIIAASPDGVLP